MGNGKTLTYMLTVASLYLGGCPGPSWDCNEKVTGPKNETIEYCEARNMAQITIASKEKNILQYVTLNDWDMDGKVDSLRIEENGKITHIVTSINLADNSPILPSMQKRYEEAIATVIFAFEAKNKVDMEGLISKIEGK